MARSKLRLAHWAALVAGALFLAGCPQQPVLFVSPLAVTFGDNANETEIRITNIGGGTLNWTVSEDLPWLSLEDATAAKQSASISGSTNNNISVIKLRADRSGLDFGVTSGQIRVESNGGTETVSVSLNKTSPPILSVSPSTVNFGTTGETAAVTIANEGREPLTFQLALPGSAPWLSASRVEGTIQPGGAPIVVNVRINRQGLAGGLYNAAIAVSSNGGNATIAVNAQVPSFSVQPTSVNFGQVFGTDEQNLRVRNLSNATLVLNLSASTETGNWLSLSNNSVVLPAQGVEDIAVSAIAAGLSPAAYTGTIRVQDSDENFLIEVPAAMSVAGFAISRNAINFGVLNDPAQDTFVLSNLGGDPLTYSITVPNNAAAWLSVSPGNGQLLADQTVTVSVDPLAVDPGAYEGTLSVNFADGSEAVVVRFSRPVPPTLVVVPDTIDLGAGKTEEIVGIWNGGIGTLNWQIATAAFPAWLSLSPVNAQGIASGTVSGTDTSTVTLRVNRNLVPPGQNAFSFSFPVTATGDAEATRTITIQGTVPQIPEIAIEADGIDNTGVNFLTIDTSLNNKDVILRNPGNGKLIWNIVPSSVPNWITGISPSQGEIPAGAEQRITLSVNRSSLTYLGAQATLLINSNAPRSTILPLRVEILVPKVVSIGVRPSTLAFGLTTSSDIIEVSNAGDPDTQLNFQVTSSKEWLSIFPETGQSTGTASPLKDWRAVSVTVDRSQLEGAGASAILTVSAYAVENGQRVPVPGVASARIEVSVEAPALTIQGAQPRLRIPSMVRSVLLMRNLRYQALPIPQTRLKQVGDQFNIFENDAPLEISETNQFLTSADRIRGNALILLDYSNSMQEAARKVADPDVAEADDPLQRLYERTISSLIDEMPSNYRIGLAIFNERGTIPVRTISNSPLETAASIGKTFINDRDILRSRLSNIVVEDNGASPILPAILNGAALLVNEDANRNFIPFDDADVRTLIMVSDGRITTPPGSISELATYLRDNYVRLLAVGWGEGVAANPLLRLTEPSGGHLYSTRNQPTGAFDAFGNPLRRPVVAELENWMTTNPNDECDQSIAKDLRSQVVFSYITLNEEAGVSSRAQLTFNDPNDQDSPCIDEQGVISGSYTGSPLDFDLIAGDPRMGQISLNTDGLVGGDGLVTARLEYAPRNVTQFIFTISADSGSLEVSRVPQTAGGVAFNWNLSQNGNVYTLTSPGAPLLYGEFGDLLNIRIIGGTAPVLLSFEVDQPSISPAPDSKYIIHPDTILVEANEAFKAPAFPYPVFETTPNSFFNGAQYIINLGSDIDEMELTLFNLGGSHIPTLAGLYWELIPSEQVGVFNILEPLGNPIIGSVFSTLSPATIRIAPDRSLEPGNYFGVYDLVVNYGSVNIFQQIGTFRINYSVGPPAMEVTPLLLDFGNATNELPLTITNAGQSTLTWLIDVGALPIWLSTSRNTFSLTEGESILTNMRVDRSQVAPGLYTYNMPITSTGTAGATVQIQMTVP